MSFLKKLLVTVTAMGVLGSVQAEPADQAPNPDTPAPMDSGSYLVSGLSTPYSFADIVNLPAGAEHRLLTGGTFSRGTLTELANVTGSTPMRPAGANAAVPLLVAMSTLNGAMDDLSAAVLQDESAASRSGNAGPHTGAGFLFSTAEIPEPADWMTLLCGLVVVAFIARRKSGSLAD